jgi:hypothetical protein
MRALEISLGHSSPFTCYFLCLKKCHKDTKTQSFTKGKTPNTTNTNYQSSLGKEALPTKPPITDYPITDHYSLLTSHILPLTLKKMPQRRQYTKFTKRESPTANHILLTTNYFLHPSPTKHDPIATSYYSRLTS